MVRSSVQSKPVCSRLLLLVAACALLPFASGLELCSQTAAASSRGQAPQARVQDELDRYLEITMERDPGRVLQLSSVFASIYPGSELLASVYQAEMRACEELGDFAGVLVWGRKAVAGLPADWATPLELAESIVNHATAGKQQTELLDEASRLTREALARLDKARPAHEVAMETWKERKGAAQSRAHEVLGLVAVQKGRKQEAVGELEAAVRLQPVPSGAQLFRLGVAYSLDGRETDAKVTLGKAAAAGPETVRTLAERELKRISDPRSAN